MENFRYCPNALILFSNGTFIHRDVQVNPLGLTVGKDVAVHILKKNTEIFDAFELYKEEHMFGTELPTNGSVDLQSDIWVLLPEDKKFVTAHLENPVVSAKKINNIVLNCQINEGNINGFQPLVVLWQRSED